MDLVTFVVVSFVVDYHNTFHVFDDLVDSLYSKVVCTYMMSFYNHNLELKVYLCFEYLVKMKRVVALNSYLCT